MLDAGVGHHHVEPAEALEGGRHRARVRLGVGQVGLERHAGSGVVRAEIDGQHVHARVLEPLRHGAPDPAGGARDEGGLTRQAVAGHVETLRRARGEAATNDS